MWQVTQTGNDYHVHNTEKDYTIGIFDNKDRAQEFADAMNKLEVNNEQRDKQRLAEGVS